jgi:enediyne biosynthesis protein E4
MKIKILIGFIIISSVFIACQKDKTPEATLFQKTNAVGMGITFKNTLVERDSLNILDYLYFYNGAGVSAGDINNDGLVDLYFVSNNGPNKLYLNKGKGANNIAKFEDITEKAGVAGEASWQTGVTMADVNGDGFLDIYVSAVSKYRKLKGHNELYINNGDLTFSEKSKEYGLDFEGFSTQAAFLDYDHDGDLDMYLLNHAVHTVSSYDKVSARSLRNNESGDFLYRNDNGHFKDVSESAGIYGAAMGYGLGISIGDFNNDGWDDIFVGNDFHENDYYYLNQHNGTFKESVGEYFEHLSRFSMGNDAADINNDGLLDLFTVDMYSDDEIIEKSSAGEDPLDIYLYKLRYGFYRQFSRNCLHLNQGNKFTDIALMAGVSATDWSWSPLFADFDNDGLKDLFISNGIRHRPNNLDYVKYITDTSMNPMMTNQAMKDAFGPLLQSARKVADKKAIDYMPDGKVHNYIYKGSKNLQFEDKSSDWGFETPTYSNGAIYVDLDNDGDLDIVSNELEDPAGIWLNKSIETQKTNFLKVRFKGNAKNTFGLGAKIYLKNKGELQFFQNYSSRGFMSSVEPNLNIGLGKNTKIDTLIIVWNTGKAEVLSNVAANKVLIVEEKNAKINVNTLDLGLTKPFSYLTNISGNDSTLRHVENPYYDFSRENLMPFKISTEGPIPAIADINNDGLDDVYMPGAKFFKGKLFTQTPDGKFKLSPQPSIEADSLQEDVSALFFDADNDKDLDLYVVSGGNEYFDDMEEQLDRLYINDGKGNFTKNAKALPPMFSNKSCVVPADFDKDGDIDLFVGGRVVPYGYGKTPKSFLLINNGSKNGSVQFTDQTDKLMPAARNIGMVTDAKWFDYDKDADLDLIVVGDWMPITVFENNKGKFEPNKNAFGDVPLNGLWQTVVVADFDNDGDQDAAVGNLGMNNIFIRDKNPILKMYVGDLDKNERIDQILAYNRGEKSGDSRFYPVYGKDELAKQMPSIINKKYQNYKDFAGKTIKEIFNKGELDNAEERMINNFASVYLENQGNKTFKVSELPPLAQASKIFSLLPIDIDNDQRLDLMVGGNFYNVNPIQGIYDGFNGLILKNTKNGFVAIPSYLSGFAVKGEVRNIQTLKTKAGKQLLVSRNNASALRFRLNTK